MSQPVMCPVCGTCKFVSITCNEPIHPSVNGETNIAVNFLVFSCEIGHVFMTLAETDEACQAIANSRLYDRHRRN
jgi:hypothetical protein